MQRIINAQVKTGLVLNTRKCEIVANDFDLVDKYPVFRDFKRVHKADMTFLDGSVLQSRATDKLLQEKIADLERATKRVALLQAHDALCLLKNSIAIPKLVYLLRTSPCFDNPLLASFDDTLRYGLSLVLNVKLDENNAQLSDIIWRAVRRAQYPSVEEPVGLSRSDGKRPNGATLIPWTRCKWLA